MYVRIWFFHKRNLALLEQILVYTFLSFIFTWENLVAWDKIRREKTLISNLEVTVGNNSWNNYEHRE